MSESFLYIDGGREIGSEYLSYAEYQLFLDELRARGQYHQPDHWTELSFARGEANRPVTGVRAVDAEAFCRWLTDRRGDGTLYRLPRADEARQHPPRMEVWLRVNAVASWCSDAGRLSLVGQQPDEGIIRQRLRGLSSLPPPPSLDRPLRLNPARINLDQRALSIAIDRALKVHRDLTVTFDLAISRAVDRQPDLNRAETLKLTRELARGRYTEITYATDPDTSTDNPRRADILDAIVRAVWDQDLHEAKRQAEILRAEGGNVTSLLGEVLGDLLDVAGEDSFVAARRAQRKYVARLLGYGYNYYQAGGRPDDAGSQRQDVLDFYWWLQIVMAREAGKLIAWEGIRIVREQV